MYANANTLVQNIKQEVLAELQHENYSRAPQSAGYPADLNNPSNPGNMGNPVNPGNPGHPPYWNWSDNYANVPGQTYQGIKDSVKNQVLAEIEMQNVDNTAKIYGLDRSLSDQRLNQMIDARYRTIDNIKSDIKKELMALKGFEARRSNDPYIRQMTYALVEEAQRRGVPHDQLIQGMDQKASLGSGITSRLSNMINTGQRKGFLCGIGTAILLSMLLPSTRSNMRSIAVRSLEEGLSVVDKAKTFVSGSSQQSPPTDFTGFNPGPTPTGNNPTNDDSTTQ